MMKKIFVTTMLTIGLITITDAQGITNTLGGNTAADKFIVENSDSETGLVVTGEGNVGIGTSSPLAKLYINAPPNTDYTPLVFGENNLDVFRFDAKYSGSGIENNWLNLHDFWGNDIMTWRNNRVGIGTNSPDAKLHVEGTVKVGVNGLVFSEIIELTGNTAYGVTDISLPSGYTEDNTRVLSLEIFSEYVGGWAGLGDDSAPGTYSFNDDNISYVLHDDMISIQHPEKVEWWEKPFRIILMKMP